MKRIYARPGFAGLRNLDQDPERRLLLSTIFLFGEYFKADAGDPNGAGG